MPSETNPMPKAVEDCHALLAWIIPHLDGFPRARRYTLGERIETGLLFVLEKLIEAAYQRPRDEALRAANLRLDVVRHLWRLSHTLKAISGGDCRPGRVVAVRPHHRRQPARPAPVAGPDDDLVDLMQRPVGLPLGNLTSQFLGNLYLNDLDHTVKDVLRVPASISAMWTI